MMAPAHLHGPPDGRFPSVGTTELLRTRLGAYLESGATAAGEEAVCDALRTMAAEARERRLHGEHMLLALKELWHDMPEVAELRDRVERQRLLGHLVSLCIDIYYQR